MLFTPIFVSKVALVASAVLQIDLNEAIILKKHSNNTFYENQTIVLGVNVSALTTSKDGKYLMVGMANGASSIFLNSGTYTIVQQIND